MPNVSVDLQDLETLVFATGAIKLIEAALHQRSNDPFVPQDNEIRSAHDRLAAVARNAKRGSLGTAVNWVDPLTDKEAVMLKKIEARCEKGAFKAWAVKPEYRLEHMEIDSLGAKGCVVLGQALEGVLWAGAERPEFKPDPDWYLVKVTPRGRERLEQYEASQNAGHTSAT
jgi:hypothetical protein